MTATPQYVSEADMTLMYGPQFMDDVTHAGISTFAVLELVNGEVDSYVRKQVKNPAEAAIKQVKTAAARLAAYQLYAQNPTQALETGAQEARRFLEAVAAGKVSLQVDSEESDSPVVESGCGRDTSPVIFHTDRVTISSRWLG